MKEVSIVFPHQLFRNHPALHQQRAVILIEEVLFFKQYRFHKNKLVFHRASMKSYENYLTKKGFEVIYIDAQDVRSDTRQLVNWLSQNKTTGVHVVDPDDEWLFKRLQASASRNEIHVTVSDNPSFLNTIRETEVYFKNNQHYFQTSFYIQERKKRNILLTAGQQPEGGKWSFDEDNRNKYPKKETPPAIQIPGINSYVSEAIEYVQKYFPDNYGFTNGFIYPINYQDAEKWLDHFIKNRLQLFGNYEDAIVDAEKILHHSVLSPLLNVGLLLPGEIIKKVLAASALNQIPLNSLEGFIRQIIGWREFIRIVYRKEGNRQRTTNYWNFQRRIPPSFWKGETGIHPIDNTIKKVMATGYCHHIERLMLLGNFMLLCEFHPDEVYAWFMELFIDSYDWVMVPNVYGMSQFADGGLMTTKPYISGSNYILKMSNYAKGPWTKIWDGLFWRFMHRHRDFFAQNPRIGMLVKTLDKMPGDVLSAHLQAADEFLEQLYREI